MERSRQIRATSMNNLRPAPRHLAFIAFAFFFLFLGSLFNLNQTTALVKPSNLNEASYGSHGFAGHLATNLASPISTAQQLKPFWFIGTVIPAHNLQRRAIIRSTWQNMYRNDSLFTTKFVISDPEPLWEPVIKWEQETYGDIIILPQLEERERVANTVKTVHMYKHLEAQGIIYPWVTKIDDDSFLDVPNFLKKYLLPLVDLEKHPPVATVTRTIIARRLWTDNVLVPGGQFYTMTWDLMLRVINLWDIDPYDTINEDELVGRLLHYARSPWDLIDLPNPVSFDYSDGIARGDGTAWASENEPELQYNWLHAVGPDAINPHKMKTDSSYLRVSACFDENGLSPIPNMTVETGSGRYSELVGTGKSGKAEKIVVADGNSRRPFGYLHSR